MNETPAPHQGPTTFMVELNGRRAQDARRYAESDEDLCMLCGAYGSDKRSLFVSCFYAIHEVVPEAIDLTSVPEYAKAEGRRPGYYLRICKSCRGRFLGHLGDWRKECVALQGRPKDHDGCLDESWEPERNIPVRINGVTVMLTREEWDARQPDVAQAEEPNG